MVENGAKCLTVLAGVAYAAPVLPSLLASQWMGHSVPPKRALTKNSVDALAFGFALRSGSSLVDRDAADERGKGIGCFEASSFIRLFLGAGTQCGLLTVV